MSRSKEMAPNIDRKLEKFGADACRNGGVALPTDQPYKTSNNGVQSSGLVGAATCCDNNDLVFFLKEIVFSPQPVSSLIHQPVFAPQNSEGNIIFPSKQL